MEKMILSIASLILISQMCWAQSLVPATSDDLQDFDSQIAKSENQTAKPSSAVKGGVSADHHVIGDKSKKDNFGALVSAEAKKLKDESKDQRQQMGQWVSDQRRKNPQAPGAPDQARGPSDEQVSHPQPNSNSGNGHSGTHGNH